jgi:hypothetical protein
MPRGLVIRISAAEDIEFSLFSAADMGLEEAA